MGGLGWVGLSRRDDRLESPTTLGNALSGVPNANPGDWVQVQRVGEGRERKGWNQEKPSNLKPKMRKHMFDRFPFGNI